MYAGRSLDSSAVTVAIRDQEPVPGGKRSEDALRGNSPRKLASQEVLIDTACGFPEDLNGGASMPQFAQASLTVLVGVFTLVAGQFIMRFLLEPIQAMRKTRGRIVHALTFYANVIPQRELSTGGWVGDSQERVDEVSKEIRGLASDILANREVIPWYGLWELIRLVPPARQIEAAAANLIGWSNSPEHNKEERLAAIAKALKINLPS
jgi:hypothetical protein